MQKPTNAIMRKGFLKGKRLQNDSEQSSVYTACSSGAARDIAGNCTCINCSITSLEVSGEIKADLEKMKRRE